jgi:carbon-monoxide dehydrogenase medium subunit
MNLWSYYVSAHSIDEALNGLAGGPSIACPVAGGSDLLLEIQQGRRAAVHTLIDVTEISELNALELRGNTLFIGAAVPLRRITDSPLVREHAQAVHEACGLIGGPQVRNTATLGGNVAHALPAADGMIGLVALGAQAEIAGANGTHLTPILSLFRGPGVSSLQAEREILVGFHIPARRDGQEASSFKRIMRPQGVALPILNAAVWLRRNGELIEDVRIVVGPSGPVPRRATEIESLLKGGSLNEEVMVAVRSLIHESIHLRSSARRAGAAYRYQLGEVLLPDVLWEAWKRTRKVQG